MSWWGEHKKVFSSIGIGLGIAAATILTAGAAGAALGAAGVGGASFGAAAGSAGVIGAGIAAGATQATSSYQAERQADKQDALAKEQAERQKELASQQAAMQQGTQQTMDTLADDKKKTRSAIKRSIYTNTQRSSKLGA